MALFDEDEEMAGALHDEGKADGVENTLKRISSHRGVKGMMILNSQGVPIRDTFDEAERDVVHQYAQLMGQIAAKANHMIRTLDEKEPESWSKEKAPNQLKFVRIRSKKHEIVIAVDVHYTMIIVQIPNAID
eukprot:Sspe_Gene.119082::Locus_114039_Transcript_1_2_Confidence_0.667_Length_459::g.119082::m.119082/K10419/DYNLRB, DNCL2; dynein light chain roadblock-type